MEISQVTYDRLVRDSEILNALREYGVDNWEGYSDAMRSLEEI